jgi:hypothetical protein
MTNLSKHVTIDNKHKPSTGMTHIANTYIVIPIGYVRAVPGVVLEDNGRPISFDDCAKALFNYWDNLLSKIENS